VLVNCKHNKKVHHHDLTDIPESFWRAWKKEVCAPSYIIHIERYIQCLNLDMFQTAAKYPDGIDHAPGVKHKQVDYGSVIVTSMFHTHTAAPAKSERSSVSSKLSVKSSKTASKSARSII
jgi:hypothetical protein